MSTRYVWGKYNIDAECKIIQHTGSATDLGMYDRTQGCFIYNAYIGFYTSIDKSTIGTISGTATISGHISTIHKDHDEIGDGPYQIKVPENTQIIAIGDGFEGEIGSYAPLNDPIHALLWFTVTSQISYLTIYCNSSGGPTCYRFTRDTMQSLTREYIYRKVTQGTFRNNVSDSSKLSFPTNDIQDNYWYTYRGSDNIDPIAISYPSTIKDGQSITLTATASSSNVYGGTITYTWEVQLDRGSWTSIGSTTGPFLFLTISYTVPKGTTTFRARVLASDDMGFTSTTYVTGSTVTVTNNTAPSTPSSISVPSSVQAGVSFTVSWGASTDSDGNLSGYTLQRKLNSGSYTTIYTGSSRSYQDTIPKSGYTSVTYRVQAYDTEGATSGYRTSNTVTIINNVAPVISGSNQNLGVFTYNPPTISYVVTDENNDTVTVTIQLDSSNIESRTVTLGQTYTVSLDWWDIGTGSHTVTITANDSQGGTATRTYTFTKNSVGQISFNRLRKKTNTGYQITYIETDSDSIITNNGQILSERISDIANKLSVSINTSPTEMVLRHRLHIKLTSEYTIDYLEMYSTNIKVGSSTLESVLVQLESKVGISNSGTASSNLNFERWRMKNSSGSYDIIYLEGISEHVIRPCGKTVEESLQAIEAKL